MLFHLQIEIQIHLYQPKPFETNIIVYEKKV